MKKQKEERGITLVALIITIIVMLILVGVSIQVVINSGLLKTAGKAGKDYKTATEEEANMNKVNIAGTEYDSLDDYVKQSQGEHETIPTTTSYVGYYADLDGDPTTAPDGIIFADLAVGNTNGQQWTNGDGVYTIPKVTTGLKDYYISQETYEGDFEPNPVLTATGEGKERFYVMSLEDFDSNITGWYTNAFEKLPSTPITSNDFGTGKANTTAMLGIYGDPTYGAENDNDMWKIIASREPGWFVPSRGEWAAFANELKINTANYPNKGLSNYYWSSSQGDIGRAWRASFNNGYLSNDTVFNWGYVRLCVTF